eukprot:TRINITY_DN9851_c0_g2_i5.p1 TRINITY_DN9851_c0_g2~~TRINITY_DN9851_c0_g2_i5.p1  ORF type:complete len:426 (+),score=98.55 TRINITY_DN9851_c0_g2_i5:81-1358(+)
MDSTKVQERPTVPSVEFAAKRQNVLMQDVDAGAPCSCGHCDGFQLHVWRQICTNCRCPREAHLLDDHALAMKKKTATLPRKGAQSVRATSKALIENWMNRLASHQNPAYDTDASAMRFLHTDAGHERAEIYLTQRSKDRRKNNVYKPSTKLNLFKRDRQLKKEEIKDKFRSCDQCEQPITGESYYELSDKRNKNGKPMRCCGRCYAEHHCPRCAGCDELIFDEEYTQAEGKDWHKGHFCCFECDKQLAGDAYTMLEVSSTSNEAAAAELLEPEVEVKPTMQPTCLDCYHANHAHTCHHCDKVIQVNMPQLTLGGVHFHNNPACFHCCDCNRYLFSGVDGGKAVMLDDRLYCRKHAELALRADVPTCRECSKPLEGECVKADGMLYHDECFRCGRCNVSLAQCQSGNTSQVHMRGGRLNCGRPCCQ